MSRSIQERGVTPLLRDVVVDVVTETGLLVVLGARPRARRDWTSDDALREEAAAERLLALDAGFPGVFRLRVSRHAPARGGVLARGAVRVGAGGGRAGDERLLAGHDPGLPLPLPRGRQRIDVRAPESDDPEAADFVLTVAPLRAGGRGVAAAAPALVEPARHPRPRASAPAARIEHRARLRAALRAAGRDAGARRAALDAYLRAEPRDARALVERAALRRAHGDMERALDDAWRATTVAPNDAAAWSALADLLAEAGRPAEAAHPAARARDLGDGAADEPRRSARGRAPTR